MPSELENLQGFSSSPFFTHSGSLPGERQLGFWSSETTVNGEVKGDSVASSRLGKRLPVGSQMMKPPECPESYPKKDQKVNLSVFNIDGAEAADSHSLTLLRPVDQDPISSTSYFAEGKKNSMLSANYENSLFSSSLSELFCRKMRLSANNAICHHSVNSVASKSEQEEPFESLEEIEAQTIGDLLPNDDDLLSGMTEGLANIAQPRNVNDLEELDIFSSIGGMDLGDDNSSARNLPTMPMGVANNQLGLYNNSVAATYPHGKRPSRTLLVRNIDGNVEDFELKTLFEQYGDLRTLYTAYKQQGFVLVSYYDIRSAQNAIKALQNRPLRHRKLDLHYSFPKDNPLEEDINQGTLVVFNVDSSVSNDHLHQIFGVYGEIKEIWESPHGGDHKVIEFYNVKAAEAAFQALNGSEIAGKRIKLEPSHSESRKLLVQQLTSELDQDELGFFLQQNSSPSKSTTGFSVPFSHITGKSSGMENGFILGRNHAAQALASPLMGSGFSTPNGLQSLLRVDPMGNHPGLAQPVQSQGKNIDLRGIATFHPHSLPEYHNGLTNSSSPGSIIANYPHVRERMNNRQLYKVSSNGQSAELNKTVLGSANGGHPIPEHHFTWSNSYQPQPTGIMLPNSPSPSFVNGIGSPHLPAQLHGFPRGPSQTLNRFPALNNHHVGSETTVNPMWDRCHAYMGNSTEVSKFHPGSLGSIGASNNSLHSMEFVSRNIFPHTGGNYMDLSNHKSAGVLSPQQTNMMFPGRGHMTPMVNLFDSSNERARSRRTENGYSQADKKQFELDIDRIIQGEDNRTTLMLKNIPNKYTSKMLLAAIDEHHKGTYDFIYLPIDFKNKCNVGYAFINMTDPKHIIPFYKAFNGKKWEKFNSEKVALLAYARIQGKAALIAHFQNSSLMNEDKRCRPILFNTEGPNAGDQVPFPMGVNIRTRPGRSRTNIHEENHQGSPPSSMNEENLTNGIISVSAKESD